MPRQPSAGSRHRSFSRYHIFAFIAFHNEREQNASYARPKYNAKSGMNSCHKIDDIMSYIKFIRLLFSSCRRSRCFSRCTSVASWAEIWNTHRHKYASELDDSEFDSFDLLHHFSRLLITATNIHLFVKKLAGLVIGRLESI